MSTDQAVRLRALLDNLQHGRMTTADAAHQVRAMQFPPAAVRTIGQRMDDATGNEIPPLPEDGGFHVIARAYHAGQLTHRQYEVLAEAAAESMRKEGEHA